MDGVRNVGAGDAVGAELSVQERDLVPQLTVFVVEFANAFVCECEALPQRGAGSALDSGRYHGLGKVAFHQFSSSLTGR